MIWFAFASVASLGVYLAIIRPKLSQFRFVAGILDEIDAAGVARLTKFRLWLLGQKTPISGMIGVLITTLPGVLEQLHLIDFSVFLAADLALKISGVIMLLMTVFHIFGIVSAARIDPKKED